MLPVNKKNCKIKIIIISILQFFLLFFLMIAIPKWLPICMLQ